MKRLLLLALAPLVMADGPPPGWHEWLAQHTQNLPAAPAAPGRKPTIVTIEVRDTRGCPAVQVAFAGARVPAGSKPVLVSADCRPLPGESSFLEVIVAAPRSARILTRAGADDSPAQ